MKTSNRWAIAIDSDDLRSPRYACSRLREVHGGQWGRRKDGRRAV